MTKEQCKRHNIKGVAWYDDGIYMQKVPYTNAAEMADAVTEAAKDGITVSVFADLADTETIAALMAVGSINHVVNMYSVPNLI